ncbi:sulfotransferase family 2 domain-containing protein [Alishewanella longhuensis]
MILNEEKKLIFIHIPKTAGTSIRNALRPNKPLIENGTTNPIATNRLSAAVNSKTKHETYSEFIEHFTARTGLAPKVLEDFTFIAFVRHPVQRFESLHRYLLKSHRKTYPDVPADLNAFVEDVVYEKHDYLKKIRSLRTQYSFIEGLNEQQLMIGRYENLTTDWQKITEHFGITAELMHLNKTTKENAGMTAQSERLISEYFATDFAHFGY